jgi:hypothetical protein
MCKQDSQCRSHNLMATQSVPPRGSEWVAWPMRTQAQQEPTRYREVVLTL